MSANDLISGCTKNSFMPLSPPVTITTSCLADLDHGQRVVDRRMRDIELARGEPFALAARVLGEMQLDLQSAPLEDALGDAGVERQRLGVGERR